MANNSIKWEGKTVNGVWKVLEPTNKRSKANSIIYKCKNLQDNQIYYKSSAYLKQFMKRGSKKLTRGKERKWIKIPVNVTYDELTKIIKQFKISLNMK